MESPKDNTLYDDISDETIINYEALIKVIYK